ncbi:NAC domain-containing protein 102-like [Carica papaya]|uniref:NAC domain-containing protein 102-like n=1 Tax=Carica papaya TaxID=3649 RepID=UPI000B8D18F6|nr:NAC domain-containing protein 102-like [Carica papaya]
MENRWKSDDFDFDFDLEEDEQSTSGFPVGVLTFAPTDELLVAYFLRNKILGKKTNLINMFIVEADVYASHPDGLPWEYHPQVTDGHRYYFVRRRKVSANCKGKRPSRTIDCGWWRSDTGDKEIARRGAVVGFKKTLSFFLYKDQAKKRNEAQKSGWIMHEYRLAGGDEFQEWALCKLYNKPIKNSKPTKKINTVETIGSMACETAAIQLQSTLPDVNYCHELKEYEFLEDAEYTEETISPMISETATIQSQSILPEVNHSHGLEEYALLEDAEYMEEMGNWFSDFMRREE